MSNALGPTLRALMTDVVAMDRQLSVYRGAYEKLTGMIEELAKREPYRKLIEDLRALSEKP